MRPNRNLLVGPRRISKRRSMASNPVGTLQARPLHQLQEWNGPFTDCVVADGHFKEACTNCYYGGQGSRCSLRHEHQNAVSHLQAEAEDAPDIPGMAPANNFGGQLGDLAEWPSVLLQQGYWCYYHTRARSSSCSECASWGRTGGPKRIAPLLVGPVGIGLAGAAAGAAGAAAILVAPQGPGVFGGTNASRARAARASAELDAVRGEQINREALENEHEEEEEDEEEDDEDDDEEEEDEEEVAAPPPAKKPKHGKKIKN
ncbi:uncharacterized protein EAF02_002893 [Botrytis sinoallii]|uniref:uncharacterized protein n=1 Tax=Botrytis sinoallii TaxID=1463999 RepID=UPI001900DFF6|nr:uncharacterized protein EAF02_002893 [Botrytis sinoallii]KAF7888352.1 hypothetical protein EAF02_002893 [Botrytis sinoallii]